MASSDYIKFDQLKIFVDEAVKPVCKALFTKRFNDLKPNEIVSNAWTIDRFLQINKDKILSERAGRQKEWVLFPISPTRTNTEQWDSSLICFLLIEICNMSKVLRTNLKLLKEYLDTIEKIAKSGVEEDKYEDYLAEIKSIIGICLSEIKDKELQKKISELSDHLEREKQTKKRNLPQDNEHRIVLRKRCGNPDESTEMIDLDKLDAFNETLGNLLERTLSLSQHVKEETDPGKEYIETSAKMKPTLPKDNDEKLEHYPEKEPNKKILDQSHDTVIMKTL